MLVWDVHEMTGAGSEPSYADFDDYRHNQRVVVIVRWFMLGSWAIINHWNADWNLTLLFVVPPSPV